MSKIALFDPNCYKFTDDMVERWESQGHETRKSLYYDPALVEWADIIWFETCDNNLYQATNGDNPEWKLTNFPGKKVICRVIDIEVWAGLHVRIDWDLVDEVIFLTPHIRDEVLKDVEIKNYHMVQNGVNLEKYKFNPEKKYNKNIAWVAERWYAKGVDLFLQYAAMLYKRDPECKIYAVGIWADSCAHSWYKAYIDYFIRENNMNVEFIDRVDDMNEFLDDMGSVILFSKKEAFSYATAEGMAKGCKPIIHNFYGAKDIWPEKYIWNTLDEAIWMTTNFVEYEPETYRREIEEMYPNEKMLSAFDKLINGKE